GGAARRARAGAVPPRGGRRDVQARPAHGGVRRGGRSGHPRLPEELTTGVPRLRAAGGSPEAPFPCLWRETPPAPSSSGGHTSAPPYGGALVVSDQGMPLAPRHRREPPV